MIITMKRNATEKQVNYIVEIIEKRGFKPHLSKGVEVTIIGIIGDERKIDKSDFIRLDGVEDVISILKPYKLASRDFHPENTIINVSGVSIGEKKIVVMAGPCAVESEEQIMEIAGAVKREGAKVLRGGAFKPRTSPYSFQGLGEEGLKLLKKAKDKTGLPVVTEVTDTGEVELIGKYTDIFQIGARNFQNYRLLKAVGNTGIPVLLKRGLSAAVPVLKKETHLPVFVDPSHGTGRRDLILPISKAAIAAGADGLIVEVHPKPEEALSDGFQSLTLEMFAHFMQEIKPIAQAMNKKL